MGRDTGTSISNNKGVRNLNTCTRDKRDMCALKTCDYRSVIVARLQILHSSLTSKYNFQATSKPRALKVKL